MKFRLLSLRLLSLVLMLVLGGAFVLAPMGASAATKDKNFLKNLPVSGTLEDGGTFEGKLTITGVGYDAVKGFTVDGVLKGTATEADGTVTEDIRQPFTAVAATLNESASASSPMYTPQAVCDILFLDLGPLSLDLLGLTVDLSEIVLDINAVSGPGNLLGNLLCAVAGLLDPGGFLTGLLDSLTALLEQINLLLR